MKKLILLAVVCTAFIPYGKKKVALKVNLKDGEVIPVVASIKSTTNMMGMETVIDMSMDYNIVSSGMKNDKYKVENKFDHIRMEMGMGMLGSMNMDSDNLDELDSLGKKGTQLKNMLEGLLKSKILFDVSERGQVSNAEFDVPEGYDLQALDPESMKGNMEQSFLTFPSKPVKVGTKWTEKRSFKNSLSYDAITTYEVIEILEDVVKLKMTADLSAKDAQQANEQVKIYDFKGTMEGETIVDIEHGLAKLASATQNISFEMEAMGQRIPTTAVNEVVLRAKL